MSDRALLAPWNSAVFGAQAKYSAIAAGLLNTPQLAVYFDHFQFSAAASGAMWQPNNSGSGTNVGNITGEASGIGYAQMSSGATASSRGSGINQACGVLTQSRAWYCATRMRLVTTPDANTIIGNWILDLATGRAVGLVACPGILAANFGIQRSGTVGSGTAIDLGIPFDTQYHIFEFWGGGASNTLFARADNGAIFSSTIAVAHTGSNAMAMEARNGATAANQSAITDWFIFAGAE